MNKSFLFLVLSSVFSLHAGDDMFVAVPVASAWTDPDIVMAESYVLPLVDKDLPQHDTQLLYGERVEILEKKESGWCKVRCVEQPHFNRKTGVWGFCDAWMLEKDLQAEGAVSAPDAVLTDLLVPVYPSASKKSVATKKLSFGTLISTMGNKGDRTKIRLLDGSEGFVNASSVSPLPEEGARKSLRVMRQNIVDYARKFLGLPYCWGGVSAYDKEKSDLPTGVDCSGFVRLVYRACGFNVPRNSHPQYARAIAVEPKDMMLGDLIFFKPEKYNFERVNHVMMYVGEGNFIEATENSKSVRMISSQDRLGVSFSELSNGKRVTTGGQIVEIYCGTFLSDPALMEDLRVK